MVKSLCASCGGCCVTVLFLLGALSAPAETHYREARDVEQAISPDEGGQYDVWLWAAGRDKASATFPDGTEVSVGRGPEEERGQYYWRRAGEVSLEPGASVQVTLEEAAAIYLTNADEASPAAFTELARTMPADAVPQDTRLVQDRGTNTVYTMPRFTSKKLWERRARQLRRRTLAGCGLWPLPEKTPLNAGVFDRYEGDGFTVEKVHFEAWPGFLVTGNLWRPVGVEGPVPGVVCPHGHWSNGRLEDGDRGSVPARGITLARMGMVAFTYDMVGYVDSRQFPDHGFYDREEGLWGIHPFALQLWSSIRAVDFLESLPDVDADRIACTGASGGGTQTFALYTVDDRVKVAAPVNMISSTMQGGCVCENAPFIRLDNSNMQIGACMAPRPLMLVSATGDWTRETPRVEYPAIKSIYDLYDAGDRIAEHQVDAGHNYNQASREQVYRFFGKWVLGEEGWEAYTEPAYDLPSEEALRVFSGSDGPADYPDRGAIVASLRKRQVKRWGTLLETEGAQRTKLRKQLKPLYGDIMDAATPAVNQLRPTRLGRIVRDGLVVEQWVLSREGVDDAVPVALYLPVGDVPQKTVIIAHGDGKATLVDVETGAPGPLVQSQLDKGRAVVAVDLFLTGDYHNAFAETKRDTQGFLETFAPTTAACRVQDLLTAKAFVALRRDLTGPVDVVGVGEAGLPVLFAGAADDGFGRVVVDAGGFNPHDDDMWVKRFYVPSIRALGDVATAAFLMEGGDLIICNVRPEAPWPVPAEMLTAASVAEVLTGTGG